jgi:hypothetical protein
MSFQYSFKMSVSIANYWLLSKLYNQCYHHSIFYNKTIKSILISAVGITFVISFSCFLYDVNNAKIVYGFKPPSGDSNLATDKTQIQPSTSGDTINPTAIDAIKSKYQQFAHTLGSPTSDIQKTGDGNGFFQEFDNGWVFWLGSLGAHEVHGKIASKWDEFNREQGQLGYPISDEHDALGGRQNDFQHGSLFWNQEKNEVTVILQK